MGMSTHMSYSKLGRRSRHGGRGFRLNSKRFCVQKLRARFLFLFRILSRWKSSYGQALRSLKRSVSRNGSISVMIKRNGSSSKRSLVSSISPNSNMGFGDCRLRSFGRSNSFYSEAIADCLEFIKRSSLSVEQNKQVNCP